MVAGSPQGRCRPVAHRAVDGRNLIDVRPADSVPSTEGASNCMSTLEDLFDDANGDLAIGELESAVEKYRRCVELDPAFFDGWHALGMALMKTGRFPEAIAAGKRGTELRPNDQIGGTSR